MFLLILARPGNPRQRAVKLLLVVAVAAAAAAVVVVVPIYAHIVASASITTAISILAFVKSA